MALVAPADTRAAVDLALRGRRRDLGGLLFRFGLLATLLAALAILVDEGKVRWSDPVSKHLPAFQLSDPFVTRELTVRDLLCHRSGLGTFAGDLVWYNTTYDRGEVLRRARFIKPATSFRSAFGYQNILFLAAGEVVPAATGKSWDDFVKDRLFTPLGMSGAVTSARAVGANAATLSACMKFLVPPNVGASASITSASTYTMPSDST